MKHSKQLMSVAPVLAVLAASAALATTFPTEGARRFDALTAMKGTWTLEAKWSNGDAFKARQTFEPILGGKFVAVHTWSASRSEAETERDFVLFGLDKDLKLTQWVYTPDGQARQTAETPTTDGTIQFDWSKVDGKGKLTDLRLIFAPVDATHYGWKQMFHKGDQWHTLLEGTWVKG